MIPPIQAIRKVLWGNIILDNKTIPVIQRNYPYDKTPCITIEDSGGSRFLQRQILNVPYELPLNHPQYDETAPHKKYPQQVLREKFDTTIQIHTWSDTGDEREKLNNIILRLFHEAQTDHYRFCEKYYEGECTSLGCKCHGEHFTEDKRGVKKQCTNPLVYGYSNIFTTYNLERSTFYLDQPYNLEDRNKDEIIYHSVLKLHTAYHVDHIIGGLLSDTVTMNVSTIQK